MKLLTTGSLDRIEEEAQRLNTSPTAHVTADEILDLISDLRAVLARNAELEASLYEERAAYSDLRDQRDQSEETRNRYAHEVLTLRARVAELERDLASSERRAEDWKSWCAQEKRAAFAAEANAGNYRRVAQSRWRQLVELRARVAELERDAESLIRRDEACIRERAGWIDECHSLMRENARARSLLADLRRPCLPDGTARAVEAAADAYLADQPVERTMADALARLQALEAENERLKRMPARLRGVAMSPPLTIEDDAAPALATRPLLTSDRLPEVGDVFECPVGGRMTCVQTGASEDVFRLSEPEGNVYRTHSVLRYTRPLTYLSRADGGPVTVPVGVTP